MAQGDRVLITHRRDGHYSYRVIDGYGELLAVGHQRYTSDNDAVHNLCVHFETRRIRFASNVRRCQR